MGEGGFVQRTGKTGERGRGRLDPAWGKREEGERRGILILHPATHTRIKLSYQNFLNPQPPFGMMTIMPNMPNMAKYAFLAPILAGQIWSSGVSLKRSCKMQFRRIGLRSIGPSSQKL